MKESDRRPIVRLALTRAELALAIGMSANSIDKMVEEGALPPPRRWHTRKLWLVTEVEASLLDLPVDGESEANPWDEPIDEPHGMTPRQKRNHQKAMERFEHIVSLSEQQKIEFAEQETREWETAVLASPLGARERTVLKQLAEAGVSHKVHFRELKFSGGDATDRLKLRGYVDWDFQPRHPDRHQSYWITAAGFAAWQTIEHLPTMGPPRKSEKKPKREAAPQRLGKRYVKPFL